MATRLFYGPGFEDCYIALLEGGSIIMSAPIEDNDEITVTIEVKQYDGDPIAVYHGETQVATLTNFGIFTAPFTAADNNGEIYIRPTGGSNHRIGFLQIDRGI